MNEDLKYRISLEDLFSKGIQNAQAQALGFEKGVGSMGSSLDRLKGQAIAAFGAFQAFQFAQGVIDTGAEFEKAQIQLKTLLGTAEAANVVFKDLQEDSTKSPFGFKEILQGNAALIASGVAAKQAKGDFDALANAIAASGKGNDELSRMVVNLQQIKNTGQASALDIKQFAFAGINIYEKLNLYYEKNHIALKNQKQDYDTIIGALKLAGAEGGQYFNALNNLADSASGRISNLSDSFDVFKDNIFVALKPAINSIVIGLTNVMNAGQRLIKFLVDHASVVKAIAVSVTVAVAAYAAWSAAIKIGIWYQGLSTSAIIVSTLATEGWTAAQVALNIAMEANPIGLLIIGVAALSAHIYLLVQDYEKLNKQAKQIVETKTEKFFEQEISSVRKLAKEYEELGLSKEYARATAIVSEKEKIEKLIKGSTNQDEILAYQTVLRNLNMKIFDVKKAIGKGEKGEAGKDLGSGLNEPKASKIQNITINMPGVLSNMKNTYATMELGVDDFMGKLSSALNSVVTDASIIATE